MRIDVSVIVVNWNLRDVLLKCLQSVRESGAGLGVELIVVDNGSTDGSVAAISEQFPEAVLVQNPQNLGFSRASNQGIKASRGRYLFLLNSDAILYRDTLPRLVAFMDENESIGLCGPEVLNLDGSPQLKSKGYFPSIPRALAHFFLPSRVKRGRTRSLEFYEPRTGTDAPGIDWLSGCALMARPAAAARVGVLDADSFMYFEDVDWCYRIKRAGWGIGYVHAAAVNHYGGESMKRQNGRAVGAHASSMVAFYAKYHRPVDTIIFRSIVWFGYGIKALGWTAQGMIGRGSGLRKLKRMFTGTQPDSTE